MKAIPSEGLKDAPHPLLQAGRHSSQNGSSTCEICEVPFTTLGAGSKSCDACLDGFYQEGSECRECPVNAECLGGQSEPVPFEGYAKYKQVHHDIIRNICESMI